MKKSFSRFGIATLAAVFAASTLVATPVLAADCGASLFAGGLGTEGSPFQISTASQLANLNECKFDGKSFVMANDISLASISPWITPSYFIGKFDGADHEITNLNLSSDESTGLFGYVEDSTIENLKVSGTADVSSEVTTFGVVAAQAFRTTIQNIEVNVDITIPAELTVAGGLAGYTDYTHISNVSVSALTSAFTTTAGSNSFGGVVGSFNNGTLAHAEFEGDISGLAENDQLAGVAGYVADSALSDLTVTGDVSSLGEYIAGIVGYLSKSSLTRGTHTGDVSSGSTTAYISVGGIVGYGSGSNISSVTQLGNVSAVATSGQSFVGGIISYLASYMNDTSSLTGATVTGNVTGSSHTGGVVGYLAVKSPISDVTATGDVHGFEYVGGIVGYQNSDISTATFNGDISGDSSIGGISGYCASSSGFDENLLFTTFPSNISNVVVNTDVVVAADDNINDFSWTAAGTIAGYSSSCNLTNAVTTGTVRGETFLGGLFGFASDGTLSGIRATVTVTSTGEHVGGLAGYASELTINDASVTGDITGRAEYSGAVGGIAGDASEIIANRIAYSGNVIGVKSVGGFFGRASNITVTDGYVSGTIKHDPTAESAVAGHISGNSDGVTLTRVYVSSEGADDYDLSLFGQGEAVLTSIIQNSDLDATVGDFTTTFMRTSAQMKIAKTFRDESWDFATVWMMNAPANNGMPMLRSLSVPSDCVVRNFSPVLFKKGSATLSGKAKTSLRKFVSQVGFGPCSALRITGYTSTFEIGKKVTPVSKLKKLAAKRAQAVKKYLNARFLLLGDSFTVTIVNQNKKSPIASNKKLAGQAKNRRVVVRVLS